MSRAPLLGIVKAEDPCSVCGGKNRFGVDSDWPLLTDHPQRIMAGGCEFGSDSATVSCPAHNALGRPKEITMLLQMLVNHPQMIGPVLKATPMWVWGLLTALTYLGLSQARAEVWEAGEESIRVGAWASNPCSSGAMRR